MVFAHPLFWPLEKGLEGHCAVSLAAAVKRLHPLAAMLDVCAVSSTATFVTCNDRR